VVDLDVDLLFDDVLFDCVVLMNVVENLFDFMMFLCECFWVLFV